MHGPRVLCTEAGELVGGQRFAARTTGAHTWTQTVPKLPWFWTAQVRSRRRATTRSAASTRFSRSKWTTSARSTSPCLSSTTSMKWSILAGRCARRRDSRVALPPCSTRSAAPSTSWVRERLSVGVRLSRCEPGRDCRGYADWHRRRPCAGLCLRPGGHRGAVRVARAEREATPQWREGLALLGRRRPEDSGRAGRARLMLLQRVRTTTPHGDW